MEIEFSMSRYLRSKSAILALLAGFSGIVLILWSWRLPPFKTSVETTDNAYVKGFVTLISPQVAGYVADIKVRDFQRVKKGELLIKIDDRILKQKVDQAEAALDAKKAALASSLQQEESARATIRSAQAQINSAAAAFHKAELSWKRTEPLTSRGVTSQSEEDSARAALEQAKASVEQANANLAVQQQNLHKILVDRNGLRADVESAKAAVELAQIDLDHSKIYAPVDGRLGEVGARLGQYVSVGTQLTAVVPDEIWVVANYKETQLADMKVGQSVILSVDALNGQKLTGHVVRFSPAAGSEFSVLKPDNATGNFTKVAQRIPVRIEFDKGQDNLDRLVPGMSVVTSIDTSQPGTIATTN